MTQIHLHFEPVAADVGFPEGPLVLADGTILLGDMKGGVVRRISGGDVSVFANTGGAPNGLAKAPDGSIYIANNGGAMKWSRDGERTISAGFGTTGYDARIERIDPANGATTRVLDKVDGRPLEAIDDLVFAPDGSFWFTDLGREGERSRSYGGVYWSAGDGSVARAVAYPLITGANGIGLSPDGTTLYATEYGAGRLWAWTIEAPGRLVHEPGHGHGGRLLWQAPDAQLLDSLKVTAAGNVVIATQHKGVFSVVSPAGELVATIATPEEFPTNLCFDPRDPGTAYVTLSTTGRVMRTAWPEPGLIPYALLVKEPSS